MLMKVSLSSVNLPNTHRKGFLASSDRTIRRSYFPSPAVSSICIHVGKMAARSLRLQRSQQCESRATRFRQLLFAFDGWNPGIPSRRGTKKYEKTFTACAVSTFGDSNSLFLSPRAIHERGGHRQAGSEPRPNFFGRR